MAALILTLHRPSFAAVFVPFAALHLWSVVRDFPHRSYHLIAAAGAFAAIAIAARPIPSARIAPSPSRFSFTGCP